MTSQQIISNLNQKIKERLELKKTIKASELSDLNAVELMWLTVYSNNGKAIWKINKCESALKCDLKDHHGKLWNYQDFILELR